MLHVRVLPALLVASFCIAGRCEVTVELTARPVKLDVPPYASIAFLTEGPAYGNANQAVRGRFHRMLFISPPVVYDRPVIRIETLTYGDEVCCRRVIGAWDLDLEEFAAAKSKFLPEATKAALRFIRWRASRAAEIRYGDLRCNIKGIGSATVEFKCTR
jgi:hypothetical protein